MNNEAERNQGIMIKAHNDSLSRIILLERQVKELQHLVIELENFRLSATHNTAYKEGSVSLAPILITEDTP